jgi:membrane dipeptidase
LNFDFLHRLIYFFISLIQAKSPNFTPKHPHMKRLHLLLPALISLASCTSHQYLHKANKILATSPIVDTHIDFPWNLSENDKWYKPGYTALALQNPEGDFDFIRAKKGGLYGAFMSIYIPAHYQSEPGRPKQVADSLITMVHEIARNHPAQFALALHADDVVRNFQKGIVSLPMGMENGAPVETLADVAYFHKRGIRYITLTHGKDNQISDSSYDTTRINGGLSDYGREVVREMNRVGIMVDVSHLSDDAIRDVLQVAKKPLIATHSACRYFTPGFERNLSDTLIKAIAKTNGVIQVPFSMYFLGNKYRTAWTKADEEIKKRNWPENGPEAKKYMMELAENGEPVYATVRDVADHIDHIKNLVGIDHVGFGSDFDGVGIALPLDLADVSTYPNLIAELLRRGYSAEDIRKVCYQNVIRVWKANE